MSLVETASNILETATFGAACAITILMRGGRPFEVTAANDWALESLLQERGAEQVFRVQRFGGQVLVEGRSRTASCRLSRPVKPRQWAGLTTRLLSA